MFRPCIDLHEGKVKQIVGGSLSDSAAALRTNFVSDRSAAWFAELYRRDGLAGGHVIMLGPGNETAARAALGAYPGGLHLGGGINADNAREWLEAGASHVIVTSWVFRDGALDYERLRLLLKTIGKERWQKFTQMVVSREALETLAQNCAQFLIHAVDVEGLCRGIDQELVANLGEWSPIPTTYAGGATSLADLETVTRLGRGRIDLTIGSALDIFGGSGVRYDELVKFNLNAAGNAR
jgi:phosphoribosylformimino-5-aminoimidazole carboxamide ribotide isomerase